MSDRKDETLHGELRPEYLKRNRLRLQEEHQLKDIRWALGLKESDLLKRVPKTEPHSD